MIDYNSNLENEGDQDDFAELQDLNEEESKAPDIEAEMQDVAGGGDDEIELEEKYHDTDIMECMSVIEHEIEYLGKMVEQIKDLDEKEFYSAKIDSLKFKRSTIQSNINNGFVTP